jgi:hypothetical protein
MPGFATIAIPIPRISWKGDGEGASKSGGKHRIDRRMAEWQENREIDQGWGKGCILEGS